MAYIPRMVVGRDQTKTETETEILGQGRGLKIGASRRVCM